jgi:hypothetical protein
MEKLMYVAWRPADVTAPAFRDRLVQETAPALRALGAREVHVNVRDEHVDAAHAPRIAQLDPPFEAVVSFWIDEAAARGPYEAHVHQATARAWPFLVVESVPLRNTTHTAPAGERTPGVNMIAAITPKAGMDREAFIAHWHTTHRDVALACQSTYAYVRNEIVRAFAPEAPPWAALVEEGFPTAAVSDPMLWYRGDGDPARQQRHFTRLMESCVAFLALDRIESHPMSEYAWGDR